MWLRKLVKDRLLVSVGHLVAAFEQGGHRHAQEGGNLQQSAAADAIGSLLVFLDLLERQFELIGKLGLSKPLLQTINPDIAANDLVDMVGPFASHKPSSSLTTEIGQHSGVRLPGRYGSGLPVERFCHRLIEGS